jgi:hypothetical protein
MTTPKSKNVSAVPSDIPWAKRSFSIKQLARQDMLDQSETTVAKIIASGKLKSFKSGRNIRVTGAAYDEYTSGGES